MTFGKHSSHETRKSFFVDTLTPMHSTHTYTQFIFVDHRASSHSATMHSHCTLRLHSRSAAIFCCLCLDFQYYSIFSIFKCAHNVATVDLAIRCHRWHGIDVIPTPPIFTQVLCSTGGLFSSREAFNVVNTQRCRHAQILSPMPKCISSGERIRSSHSLRARREHT